MSCGFCVTFGKRLKKEPHNVETKLLTQDLTVDELKKYCAD